MSDSGRKFLVGLILVLIGGALVGWFYGSAERGLLVAALLSLIWLTRNLLAFERAVRTHDSELFRYGEGIWQQIFSRFSFEHQRATRRKSRYRQLLKEVRKSTDAMPDGAVILGSDNAILMCNRSAKTLVGLKPKKDRGQRVDNILRTPALNELLQADDPTKVAEIPSPLRENAWLHCRVVPYGGEQKLLIIRDVTERARLSKMRKDFVANVSHELRSPLTVISGYLDSIAEESGLAAEWKQPIAQMRAQADRMTQMLIELLELSRLESAGQVGTDALVDIVGLLNDTKESFRVAKYSHNFVVEAESSKGILGNAAEIESLLANLISNARRHTPADGTITVSWRTGSTGGDLTVSDTGEGIAAEHIPRLTERFFRVDRGRSRDDGGVGLGLAIVKHILSRHDGFLAIESTLGEGSSFRCHFPPERLSDPV